MFLPRVVVSTHQSFILWNPSLWNPKSDSRASGLGTGYAWRQSWIQQVAGAEFSLIGWKIPRNTKGMGESTLAFPLQCITLHGCTVQKMSQYSLRWKAHSLGTPSNSQEFAARRYEAASCSLKIRTKQRNSSVLSVPEIQYSVLVPVSVFTNMSSNHAVKKACSILLGARRYVATRLQIPRFSCLVRQRNQCIWGLLEPLHLWLSWCCQTNHKKSVRINSIHHLVGGFNHLEKYERQWEGLSPAYYGK